MTEMTYVIVVLLALLYLLGGLSIGLICMYERPSKNSVDYAIYGLAALFWPIGIVALALGFIIVGIAMFILDPLILKLKGDKPEEPKETK